MGPRKLRQRIRKHCWYREKLVVLSSFFISVITNKTSLQGTLVPETREKVWSKEVIPLVEDN